VEGLRDLGYVEGQTIALSGASRRPAATLALRSAAELVRLPVDMVVARTTPANRAAQQATSGVPSLPSAWPTRWKPGSWRAWPSRRHLTGTTSTTPTLDAKHLEILREVVPGVQRVAVLVDATSLVWDAIVWNQIRTAAEQTGVQ